MLGGSSQFGAALHRHISHYITTSTLGLYVHLHISICAGGTMCLYVRIIFIIASGKYTLNCQTLSEPVSPLC